MLFQRKKTAPLSLVSIMDLLPEDKCQIEWTRRNRHIFIRTKPLCPAGLAVYSRVALCPVADRFFIGIHILPINGRPQLGQTLINLPANGPGITFEA